MDESTVESATEFWGRTREAVAHFRKLLLCSKWSCAGPGAGCSVCHSPAWVKDVHKNRQLGNITELFLKLEALLHPPESTASSAEPSPPSPQPSVLTKKKNLKIWFSPKSRGVRCSVATPAEDPAPGTSKLKRSNPLSVFNFSSSQDSGSSTPPGPGPDQERRKKRKRRSGGSVPRTGPATRHQSRRALKRMRLEAVNQQWGFGQEGVARGEKVPVDRGGEPRSKRVSFQCSGDEIPPSESPGTRSSSERKSPAQISPPTSEVTETEPGAHSSPIVTPKRSRPEDVDQQRTPKRPRSSPGRRRRSGPVSETSKEGQKETRSVSPAPPRAQSSPGYMKRNHKGETPLHLAAIKGDAEMVRELLAQGADPNLKDHAGWTPLHEACNLGHVGVVEVLLLQGAMLNTPGYENDSPLHDAVRNGHVAAAKLLLERGALTSVLNIFGLRPVDYAATPEMREVLSSAPEATPGTATPISSPANQLKSAALIKRDVQVTLISSSLTQVQQNQLHQSGRVLGAKRVEVFSSAVTHVIVPDGPAPSTLTVLRGILNGCWVVTFPWLSESLQQGRWMEEEDFEADEGPRRARVNRVSLLPPLFDGCFFYLLGSFGTPSRDELVQLVRAGGGQLLTRQPKADSDVTQTVNTAAYHARPDSDQAFCTHYVLYEPRNSSRPGPVRLGKVWSAPSSWLLDCIEAFGLLPVPELG